MRIVRRGSIVVVAVLLILSGCGTSGKQIQNNPPAQNGAQTASPSTAAPDRPDGSEAKEGQTELPVPSKPGEGSARAEEPLVLTDMEFISEKQGWTAAETKTGSEIRMTHDGGATWKTAPVAGLFVRALGFANASEGWAAGKSDCREEMGQRKCSRLQLKHSKDGGTSWETQWERQGQDVNLYGKDEIFAMNDRQVFAIAGGGMLRTTDGGSRWSPVDFHIGPYIPEQASFSADGKSGWVMGRAGKGCKPDEAAAREQCAITIVHTTDGGEHWKLQWSPQDSTDLVTVGISFINAQTGWMMILSYDTLQSSLYGTKDAGAHWTKLSEMRGGRPYTRGLQFVSDTTGFVPLSAGAGPIGGGLAVTRDGGKQFDRKVEEGKEWSFEELKFFGEKLGWVRVSDPLKGDYLMFTADGGNNWNTGVQDHGKGSNAKK